MDHGHEIDPQPDREHGREHRPWHELDWDRDPKSPERSAGGDRSSPESGGKDREIERGDGRSHGPEKTPEPKQKSVEMDREL